MSKVGVQLYSDGSQKLEEGKHWPGLFDFKKGIASEF